MKIYSRLHWKLLENEKVVKHGTVIPHSFVKAFPQLLYANMSSTNTTITDFTNTPLVIGATGQHFKADGLSGDPSLGINIGTGTVAPTINDIWMQSYIPVGTGAGQMLYGAVSFIAPVVTGGKCTFFIQRIFTNNSGNSIAVSEVGITVNSFGADRFTIERTVIAPILVLNTQSLQINYEIGVTV